jgi:hypothetical protein
MESLADNGIGNYAYVDDLDKARKLFVEELTSTLQVIALDAKIQVDFNPDVVAYYRLIGYENRDVCRRLLLSNSLDFRNDVVDAGEIDVGHSATALGPPGLRPRSWSSRFTAYRRSCGMIRKWSSSWPPVNLGHWSARPADYGSGKLVSQNRSREHIS